MIALHESDKRKEQQKYYDSEYSRVLPDVFPTIREQFIIPQMIHFAISQCGPNSICIDVGCGGMPKVCAYLDPKSSNALVVGIDISRVGLEKAKSSHQANLHLVQADAQNLPLKPKCADLVCTFELIEHVPHPSSLLIELERITKKRGMLIIGTPNKHFLLSFHGLEFRIVPKRYVAAHQKIGHDLQRFYSLGELCNELSARGFEAAKVYFDSVFLTALHDEVIKLMYMRAMNPEAFRIQRALKAYSNLFFGFIGSALYCADAPFRVLKNSLGILLVLKKVK